MNKYLRKGTKFFIPFILAYGINTQPANAQQELIDILRRGIEEAKENIETRFDEARENISEYVSERSAKIRDSFNRNLEEIINDPSRILEFEREAKEMFYDYTVDRIRNINVLDTRDNRVKTLDTFTKELVLSSGHSLYGSDLQKDPIKTGFLLMVDRDYLLHANMINYKGDWISIVDVAELGIENVDVDEAIDQYELMKYAYVNEDKEKINYHLINFFNEIKEINSTDYGESNRISHIEPSSSNRAEKDFDNSSGTFFDRFYAKLENTSFYQSIREQVATIWPEDPDPYTKLIILGVPFTVLILGYLRYKRAKEDLKAKIKN